MHILCNVGIAFFKHCTCLGVKVKLQKTCQPPSVLTSDNIIYNGPLWERNLQSIHSVV